MRNLFVRIFLVGSLILSLVGLFQNCSPNSGADSDSLNEKSGTDTGNVQERYIVAEQLPFILCYKAAVCSSAANADQCRQVIAVQPGLPAQLGAPAWNTMEELKTAEVQGVVHADLDKSLRCLDSFQKQSCEDLNKSQDLTGMLSADCSQIYSESK